MNICTYIYICAKNKIIYLKLLYTTYQHSSSFGLYKCI